MQHQYPLLRHALLSGTVADIKQLLVDATPAAFPRGSKCKLIDELFQYMVDHECHDRVCCEWLQKKRSFDIATFLTYAGAARIPTRKLERIQQFIELDNSQSANAVRRDSAGCAPRPPPEAQLACDVLVSVTDFEIQKQAYVKLRRRLQKVWTKGANILLRKHVSKKISACIKKIIGDVTKRKMLISDVKAAVEEEVGRPLDRGRAGVFFHKKMAAMLAQVRKRRRPKKYTVVMIREDMQLAWREMQAMRAEDAVAIFIR
jgi:hypothetical protein